VCFPFFFIRENLPLLHSSACHRCWFSPPNHHNFPFPQRPRPLNGCPLLDRHQSRKYIGLLHALIGELTTSKGLQVLANLTVDAELLQTAIDIDTQNTKETIVEVALCEYIYHRQQLKKAVMIGGDAAVKIS
jgi:hypothetical protein